MKDLKKHLPFYFLIVVFILLINLLMYLVFPENRQMNIIVSVMVMFGLIGIIIPMSKSLKIFFNDKKIRTSVTGILSLFLILSIFSMINYLTLKNDAYIDLTQNKLNTLSEESLEILDNIKEPLFIKLFSTIEKRKKFTELFKIYQMKNPNIDLEVFNPDENIAIAGQYNIKEDGEFIFEYNKRIFKGNAHSEKNISLAFKKAFNENNITFYSFTGHGEPILSTNQNNSAYSYFINQLLLDGAKYFSGSLQEFESFFKENKPNLDHYVFLIFAPQSDYSYEEIKFLKNLVALGAKFHFLLSVNFNSNQGSSNFNLFLKESFGIERLNSLLVDKLSMMQKMDVSIIRAKPSKNNSLTKTVKIIEDQKNLLFPLSEAISLNEGKNFKHDILLETDIFPSVWGESDLSEILNGKSEFSSSLDFKGPFPLALVANNSITGAKATFWQSIHFISNSYKSLSSNFNLFININNHLYTKMDFTPKSRINIKKSEIIMNDIHFSIIIFGSIIFIPAMFLIWALFNLYRKNRYV